MDKKNVEAIYPLSPMQQGMLFEALYSKDSYYYIEQVSFSITRQGFDPQQFMAAWQHIVNKYQTLRSLFVWEKTKKPLQIILKQLELHPQLLDWTTVAEQEQAAQLQKLLQQDRNTAFEVEAPPLMRFYFVQLAADKWHFIWTHHHLLMDGWSLGIVLKDLFEYYQAITQQKPLHIQPTKHYANYVQWLAKQDANKAQQFWQDNLKDAQIRQYFNSSSKTPCYSERKFSLPEQLQKDIQQLTQQHQLTFFTIMQGAWAFLLSRYANQNDVMFGTTVSGRTPEIPQVESIVGLLINTLPVRVQIGEQPLVDWLKHLQQQHTEREQFAYLPLAHIQTMTGIKQGQKLFDSLLIVENYPLDQSVKQYAELINIQNFDVAEKIPYPLLIGFLPHLQLQVRFTYDANQFDDAAIQQLFEHFQFILTQFVAQPTQALHQFSLLTEKDKTQLEQWNQTEKTYPQQCVHQLFEQQVTQTPDAIAAIFEDENLTYQQLNEKSNQLAHYLQSLGVKTETLVGVCVERSLDMLVSLLGILKSGGAYVPLDPTYPEQRLAFMLEDADTPIILTQSHLLNSLPPHQAQTVCLDTDWEQIAQNPTQNLNINIQLENLAYVIYTSGSTGKPKGAMNPHLAVSNRLLWMQDAYQLTEQDTVLQKTPFSFDVSVWEFFWPILAGAKLVFAKPEGHKSPDYLAELIGQQQVTTLHFVPSMLQAFLLSTQLYKCYSLRQVFCSGEALSVDLQNRFFELFPQISLHNLYGPTEAAVDVTYWQCQPEEKRHTVPIGKPISNIQIHILDEQLQPVPIGVSGELHIGGIGVARGYHNRPELSAEKFIPNHFTQQGQLYKTGDLARYLPDGNIEYLGRIDFQVKIRGFRIELGEIEALINQFPTVQTSLVNVYETQGDKKLVAYLVADTEIQQADLKTHLKQKLPDYMLPSYVVQLEDFPLTPNGKVDRKALPEPEHVVTTYIAPRNELEQTLAEIWQTILEVPRVGLHDNFFELGGHSLLSVRLTAKVQETFNIKLSVADIFKSQTLLEFSQLITPQSELKDISIPVVSRKKPLLASFPQQNLWLMNELDTNGTIYNISIPLHISGKLDVVALKNSFNALLQRHEVLRTVFNVQQDKLVQVVKPYAFADIGIINLQHLPTAERLEAAKGEILQRVKQRKDLTQDTLFGLFVFQLDEAESVLTLLIHHIISDGCSITNLFNELNALYEHFAHNKPLDLPVLQIQYADAAAWQHQQMQGEQLQKQLDYWKQQLKDNPSALPLPTDYPKRFETKPGGIEKIALEKPLVQKLVDLRQQHNTSNFVILLTALKILLYKWTQQADLVVGTVVAGRNHSQMDHLLGCFINLLAIRSKPDESQSALAFFKQVHKTVFDAYDNQECPFTKVVEALNQEQQTSHNTIYNVAFLLQNFPKPAFSPDGLAVSVLNLNEQHAYLDLRFIAYESDEQILFECEYNTDLFKPSTIQYLLQNYSHFLAFLVEMPDLPLSQFSLSLHLLQQAHLPHLLQASEQKQLDAWNATQKIYPHTCLHQLVERQVQATPDAVAVIYDNQPLTYKQLNQKANQLAHYLRYLGVQTEDFVGIYVERSLEMMVGLLGILKAGAAYVPLDPSYPAERIEFMLQDAAPPVLLTQQHLLSTLPHHHAQPVCLDRDWGKIAKHSRKNPNLSIELDQLAYMIYTSGSTGKPKGAMNPHLAISNRLLWMQDAYQLSEHDTVLQKTPFSFDVSVWEFFWPLLAGAKLVFAKPEGHKDAAYLAQLIQQSQVTTLHFVPSMLQLFLQAINVERCTSLRQVFCSGEALPVDLQNKFFDTFPHNVALHNLYGPTEAAVDVTYWQCQPDEKRHTVPIGKPINNIQIHILDQDLRPVPIGLAGELHIAGIGVARGYHNRPELSAEKFIENPLGQADTLVIPQPESHLSLTQKLGYVFHSKSKSITLTTANQLYKTGDLARWLPDGEIEYLGRLDHQVKIRGFRIELGEIEAAITQSAQVNECVVLVKEGDEIEDKQLIAFIVPEAEPVENQESAYVEQVSEIYHHTYGEVDEQATDFNIAGWNSSYTGKAIPGTEMQEWVKYTVQRILALKPQHIVEIGCGTGLLLSRIAPHCQAYLGLDLSAEAVAHVSQLQKSHPELDHVNLQQAPADDFSAIAKETHDTLVINSVVQHFPSIQYFTNVLAQAVETVKDGGRIFIGDIRSFGLLETYHASVQLYQAHCEINLAELSHRIEKQLVQEEELVVDPAFFVALQAQHPRIQHIEIYPKRGEFFNELTKFRFDVVLHIGQTPNYCEVAWQDWQPQWDLTAIREHLVQKQPQTFGLNHVSNLRLVEENVLLQQLQQGKTEQTIAAFRQQLDKTVGLNPEALYQLADELDYQIEISWLNTDKSGQFSVVFKQADVEGLATFTKPSVDADYQMYANAPLQQSGLYQQQIVTDLKQVLQKQLPDYMNPAHYVLLEHIPLTPNGKADRNALLAMDIESSRHIRDLKPARDDVDQALIEIWQEVLNVKPIGITDNFFDLGGHSLLAIRVMSKIHQQFGQNLPLAALFEGATIESLARIVRGQSVILNWNPVVKIQPNGDKPTLYCVPGSGGNVLYYYELAHALGIERPFYGLQARGLDGIAEPLTTVEEIAAYHVNNVRQVQPTGPYYICGHSFGVYVAFEMARQLEQQGEEIALLAILDLDASYGYTKHSCHHWDEVMWILEISKVIEFVFNKKINLKKRALLALDSAEARYFYFKEKLESVNFYPPNTPMEQFMAQLNVYKADMLATTSCHKPQTKLKAKIALFKTKTGVQTGDNAKTLQEPTWDWQQLAEQTVDIYDVDGDHNTMIQQPHVIGLAEKLNQALDKA
ncbi:amino acid adenylation domain-containing protein [Candidatus Albibeggiatoa sp. nov. NOAA]|uniref:amino acid adenylation domain-containing protein n=1 Tax=Candidatus Albibeggiatoa sp. nov. NOAA TaxID=3162724 RepID=UPI0032FAAD0E|nr:amino acid adenylation domain-containing protein [Thiotrichaceae bacterium]